ncbi:MAG: hypothetical protein ACKVT1_06530 [Dehalococcoidia bacterium]
MKDQLIAAVAEKAGLPPDKATEVVDAVLAFLKEHPADISSLVGLPETHRMADAKEKLGEAKEKLAPVGEKLGEVGDKLGPIGEKVGGRIGRMFGKKDDSRD